MQLSELAAEASAIFVANYTTLTFSSSTCYTNSIEMARVLHALSHRFTRQSISGLEHRPQDR